MCYLVSKLTGILLLEFIYRIYFEKYRYRFTKYYKTFIFKTNNDNIFKYSKIFLEFLIIITIKNAIFSILYVYFVQ